MTIFNPSSATRQITIQEMVYSTFMTIYAPSLVDQGVSFPISGRLTFMEGTQEFGIQGRTIELTYNGTSLGSVTTDDDGGYATFVTMDTSGTFTLKAAFAGGSGLSASSASIGVQIGDTPPVALVIIALAAYFLLR